MKTITLLIIAKTNWDGAFCYLGYDTASRRILRPVLFQPGSCLADARIKSLPKSTPLQIGFWYRFELNESLILSLSNYVNVLPHSRDDIFVQPFYTQTHCPSIARMPNRFDFNQPISSLYAILEPLAKRNIEDIYYPTNVIDRKYVIKGTDCPSVGVLCCRIGQLEVVTQLQNNKTPRMKIHGMSNTYSLSFTALSAYGFADFINYNYCPDEPVLLLFSTARPWAGYPPDRPFDPPRCYILVVGVVRKYYYINPPPLFHPGHFFEPLQQRSRGFPREFY